MAQLIAITRPGSSEPGFIVSGVPMPDGSRKDFAGFGKDALQRIFEEIKTIRGARANGHSSNDHGRVGRGQVNQPA